MEKNYLQFTSNSTEVKNILCYKQGFTLNVAWIIVCYNIMLYPGNHTLVAEIEFVLYWTVDITENTIAIRKNIIFCTKVDNWDYLP